MVMTSGSGTPERGAAPFFFAPERRLWEGGRPISEFMQNAPNVGVKFFICSASLELNDMSQDDLIEDADKLVGSIFPTE